VPTSETWRGAVLDSFAILAYLQDEPGAEPIEHMLARHRPTEPVLVSWVNLGEVLYIVRRERGPETADLVLAAVDQLPVEIVAAGRALTLEAARFKSRYAISYADAFCAASELVSE
jgi:uncharacterized protein with PIN domain